jgi:hypothetical protein
MYQNVFGLVAQSFGQREGSVAQWIHLRMLADDFESWLPAQRKFNLLVDS